MKEIAEIVYNILFAGFGGQGVQFAAKVTAYAGMEGNFEVSLLPSYGPEMRGGTSNCAVRILNMPIASPIVYRPNILLALNEPSYDKFAPVSVPDAAVFYDSSLFDPSTKRDDIKLYPIPATKLAKENELPGLANIIALGYMVKKTSFLPFETIKAGLTKAVPATKAEMLEKNLKALEIGYNLD